MITIKEDFVSFETAKLLKEKGFKTPVETGYYGDGRICHNLALDFMDYNHEDGYYSRPTIQMAMKWLREVHKISIEITSTGYLIDNDVEWECDIKIGHRLYFRHITNEKSFESCAEAAIKYCLKNLI